MKTFVALLMTLAVLVMGPMALASESRRAVEEADHALTASPPQRDAARAACKRALAANDDPPAMCDGNLLLGQIDEEDGNYPQALADDHAATVASPNTRCAIRASDRAEWLQEHSEGDFAPLRRVEAVRHDPNASSDPAVIESLAKDLESFPPGNVKVEARMLVAEAWLSRLNRPAAAVDQLRAVTIDPKADPLTSRLAERQLVLALQASGRIEDAIAEARTHSARLDPGFVRSVSRLVRRRTVRRVSIAVLCVFGVMATVGLVAAARRRSLGEAARELKKLAPVAALFIAFIAIAGGYLASKYESGNTEPFLYLGGAVFPLLLVARAWSAVGLQKSAARVGRALLCGATVVAAAFVLLDTMNPQYLNGFGL